MTMLQGIVLAIVALPMLAVAVLALPAWFGVRWRESAVSGVVAVAFGGAALCALVAVLLMLVGGHRDVAVPLGTWFEVGHYRFEWGLLGDRLSLPFAAFSALLVGLIGAFSSRYLHRERGFFRFYLMLALFGAGVEIVVLASALDQVFFGWELVGITSALLIAFFHERPKPVEHGLRAFITYRACDVGLLGACAWLHHSSGSAAFATVGGQPWDAIPAGEAGANATFVGLLLLWASMGKSAQVPLGGWLPRAMEGPTPSSAIFYGSISVHLGPYLLLRASPLLQASPVAAWMVIAIGAATALHGAFVGRVQTDIKSVLAYASMTQVGLIFVEIGLGWHFLPLIHIVGHAAVRSLEILRSPSLLQDHQHLERALGRQVPGADLRLERGVPSAMRPWLYRHALERGGFDTLLREQVVGRFLAVVRLLDRGDRWCSRRVGGSEVDAAGVRPAAESGEVSR